MKTWKRVMLLMLALPLVFNAGYDVTQVVLKRRVVAAVTEAFKDAGREVGMSSVYVYVRDCYRIPDMGWLCDVEAGPSAEDHERRMVPVPIDALKR